MTPLMHAAWNGHLDCVRLLIGRGADVHKRANSMTAAHCAAQGGHDEVLLALFDAGVAVDVTDDFELKTPLMYACIKGHTQCVLSLLRHGADVHKAVCDGMTAAHYAAVGGNREILLAILDAGAAVDVTDGKLMTPLMCAARSAKLECLLLLIQRGADVRHHPADGWTAAHYAAQWGSVEMLRVLIASGADLFPLAGCQSVVDIACLSSQMDAASFALACVCWFGLWCNEIESQAFYGFRRVICGLSNAQHTL